MPNSNLRQIVPKKYKIGEKCQWKSYFISNLTMGLRTKKIGGSNIYVKKIMHTNLGYIKNVLKMFMILYSPH